MALEDCAVALVLVSGPKPRVQEFVRQYAFDPQATGTLQPGEGQSDEPGAVRIAEAASSGG